MSIELIIDDRERKIIPYIKSLTNIDIYAINYKIDRITVGDYAIMYRGHVLLTIERKTWTDLASSFRDGRKQNVKKLIELRKNTNCKIIYIIEGPVFATPNKLFGRIPHKNLEAHLDHLRLRDNIMIVHTKNYQHTAQRLLSLAKSFTTIKHNGPIQIIDAKEGKTKEIITGNHEQQLKKKSIKSTMAIQEQILQCLPGISSIMSSNVIEKYTLTDLFIESNWKGDMSLIKFASGASFGIKRANRIQKNINAMKNNEANAICIRVLACIPGISKPTAINMLKQYTLNDIINGEVTKDQLANCSKGTKSRVGPKAAKAIMEMLCGYEYK